MRAATARRRRGRARPVPDRSTRRSWRSRAARSTAALVPIENSLEGGVNATLDALALETREVEIVGETVLAIRNCLIARDALELDAIQTVVSHPQPLGQCARFLREQLPRRDRPRDHVDRRRRPRGRRADAPWARARPASGRRAARRRVLREGVEDEPDNATRFVWLARDGDAPARGAREGAWKTSVVFAGAGDGSPGWLVRCLSEFAFRGVNLTKIESRPREGRLGHYLFLVDWTAAPRTRPSPKRSRRCASTARRSACSGAIRGVSGTRLGPPLAPLHFRRRERRHGDHTHQAHWVRAGHRAPAART